MLTLHSSEIDKNILITSTQSGYFPDVILNEKEFLILNAPLKASHVKQFYQLYAGVCGMEWLFYLCVTICCFPIEISLNISHM